MQIRYKDLNDLVLKARLISRKVHLLSNCTNNVPQFKQGVAKGGNEDLQALLWLASEIGELGEKIENSKIKLS